MKLKVHQIQFWVASGSVGKFQICPFLWGRVPETPHKNLMLPTSLTHTPILFHRQQEKSILSRDQGSSATEALGMRARARISLLVTLRK